MTSRIYPYRVAIHSRSSIRTFLFGTVTALLGLAAPQFEVNAQVDVVALEGGEFEFWDLGSISENGVILFEARRLNDGVRALYTSQGSSYSIAFDDVSSGVGAIDDNGVIVRRLGAREKYVSTSGRETLLAGDDESLGFSWPIPGDTGGFGILAGDDEEIDGMDLNNNDVAAYAIRKSSPLRTPIWMAQAGVGEDPLFNEQVAEFRTIEGLGLSDSDVLFISGKLTSTGEGGLYKVSRGGPLQLVAANESGGIKFDRISVNNVGNVAVLGRLPGLSPIFREAIFLFQNGEPQKIVALNDPVIVNNETWTIGSFDVPDRAWLDGSGRVVFEAVIVKGDPDHGTFQSKRGIFSTTGVVTPPDDPEPEDIEGHHWTNPEGGEFNTVQFWSDENENTIADDVPGSSDTAVFSLPSEYTVSLTEDQGLNEMIITNNGSKVTLNADGHRFTPGEIFVGYVANDNATLIANGQEFETNSVILGEGGIGKLLISGETDFKTGTFTTKSVGSQVTITRAGVNDIDLGYINMDGGSLVVDGFPTDNILAIGFSSLEMENARVDLINGGKLYANLETEILIGSDGGAITSVLNAQGVMDTALGASPSGLIMDGDLAVGFLSPGLMEILNGASIDIANEEGGPQNADKGELSIASGQSGEVLVSGVNSIGDTRSNLVVKDLIIGAQGSVGTLTIGNGALLNSLSSVIGGDESDHQVSISGAIGGIPAEWDAGRIDLQSGTISIGTGGELTADQMFNIGPDGNLFLTDGGKAELNPFDARLDGYFNISGLSPVTIPSLLTFTDGAFFGSESPTEIVVENGGKLQVTSAPTLMGVSTGGNSLIVTGIHPSGTRSTVEFGDLQVGGILSPESSGDVYVEKGALLVTKNATIVSGATTGETEEETFNYPSIVFVGESTGDTVSTWINTDTLTLGSEEERNAVIHIYEAEVRTNHLKVFSGSSILGIGTFFVLGEEENNGYLSPGFSRELVSSRTGRGAFSALGKVVNNSHESLAVSTGSLAINGSYTQGPKGVLRIEIAGPEPENQDRLVVTGNVTLEGTLQLIFSGYAPSENDTFPVIEVAGDYSGGGLDIEILGLKPGFQSRSEMVDGKLAIVAETGGQLLTVDDPITYLKTRYAPGSGITIPIFTVEGATYRFETSTNLVDWSLISEVPGTNNLIEFSKIPSLGENRRFYRVTKLSGSEKGVSPSTLAITKSKRK